MPKSCQLVAARALLGMEQRELARLAEVSVSTLIRLEGAGWQPIPGNMKSVNRVLDVLERKHVVFTDNGVALTRKPRG